MKSLFSTLVLLLTIALGTAVAQQAGVTLMDKSTMQIDGTSTIHDWTADVEKMSVDIDFDASALAGDTLKNPVNSLSLSVPVESIESGKGGMNRKIYGALKKDDHPNITYELSSSDLADTSSDSLFQLNTTGMLNVAGVSKEVSFPVEGSMQEDGSYKFTGSYEINMKDYDVDPPSAVFGTIKSGELVTISFEMFFK